MPAAPTAAHTPHKFYFIVITTVNHPKIVQPAPFALCCPRSEKGAGTCSGNSSLLARAGIGIAAAHGARARAVEPDRRDIATIRSTNLGANTEVVVEGYYGNGTAGGGPFYKQAGGCATTATGRVTSGSDQFVNYSGQLYVGEPVANGTYLPANTTVLSTTFTGLPAAASMTGGSSTLTGVPYVANITPGMYVSAPHIDPGTKVTGVTAPGTVITTTGTLNNGNTVTITGSMSGITTGMYIVMTGDTSASPNTTPRSAIKPGTKIVSIAGSVLTLTGTFDVSGSTDSGAAQLYISTGGTITMSANAHAIDPDETHVIFYGRTAGSARTRRRPRPRRR